MIDILYIIGPEGPNHDLELKCSLRSLYKHVKDWARIFITGRCPDFINQKKVIFTPCENESSSKMINHWIKVQKTIDETNIGENFVLMYDDIFFTKDTRLEPLPFYQKGKLGEDKNGGKDYQKSLDNTRRWLKKNKMTIYDHELHIPCVYNKIKFSSMKTLFLPQIKDKHPFAIRSIYANLFELNQPYKHDVKIRKPEDTQNEQITGQEFVSTTDWTFPFLAASIIEPHIQDRSPWEK